jgi:hypothetical protein
MVGTISLVQRLAMLPPQIQELPGVYISGLRMSKFLVRS